jgi:hypothetical protein
MSWRSAARDGSTGCSEALWAVTTYFNPFGFRRRRANYAEFRRRLPMRLLTVELSYGGAFEPQCEADIVVRVAAEDVMWQKERLLNTALAHLPPACSKVIVIDCDLVLDDSSWPQRVAAALDVVPLVQPFDELHHLAESGTDVLFSQPSLAAAIERVAGGGRAVLGRATMRKDGEPAAGMIWAARRALLAEHGFYDACIVGGGDTALACAAYESFDTVMDLHFMNDQQRQYYLRWSLPFARAVGGKVGCVPARVSHLWHGSMADRSPRERHRGLAPFGFDPARDIAVSETGPWRWSSDKPLLRDYARRYMASRNEDGGTVSKMPFAAAVDRRCV